jgi:hypothetical protein
MQKFGFPLTKLTKSFNDPEWQFIRFIISEFRGDIIRLL